MKNIEIKVGVDDFSSITEALEKNQIKLTGVLNQIDTYFESEKSRLKLREINGNKYVLIGYKRPDEDQAKLSDFDLLDLSKEQAEILKKILVDSNGVKVIVKKRREFWMYNNTRIHLDAVDGLGNFLELESVVVDGGMEKAKKEYEEVYAMLDLDRYKKYKKSYSDLLMENI